MDINKTIDKLVSDLEVFLELPKEFLSNIYYEDDWSFFIKSHALLESALTNALRRSVPYVNLLNEFSHLPISQYKIGKIYFAQQMGLITKEERILIEKFSDIRNKLVHDIRNINNPISQYYNKSLKRCIGNAFLSILTKNIDSSHHKELNELKFLSNNPKQDIFLIIVAMITSLYGKSLIIQKFVLRINNDR